jgi:hypothetical protein
VKARKVLDALVDPYIALGMTCIVPLLDCINSLIKFAQARNVFICDFVAALTACQVNSSYLFVGLTYLKWCMLLF